MKRGFLLFVPLLLVAAVFAQGEDAKALIEKLGAEDYAVREEATQKLIEMGDSAVPALEEALKSEDLEVRLRAGRALRAIRGEKGAKPREEEGHDLPAAPGSTITSFGLSIQPGKVTATVTEMVDGKPVTRTYEAATVDELKEKYPELRKHLGDSGGFRFHFGNRDDFDMDDFWQRWNRDLNEDMRNWQEETRRDVERMQRWLELWRDRPRRQAPEQRPPAGGIMLGVRASEPTTVLDAQLELRGRGIVVDAVEKGSIADRLGLERFDILIELNGREIRKVADVPGALAGAKEGDLSSAKVIRRAQVVSLHETSPAAPK